VARVTIAWVSRPTLRRPVLVAAFEGWNDAGDAASDAVRWLGRRFDAQTIATLDAEEYLDFQAARPHVELVRGTVRRVTWPATNILAASLPHTGRDLVLVLGVEPNLRWPSFCGDVLGAARELGCDTVVTLGALLADSPHSRPPRITGTAADETQRARVGMRRSRYEGPTGIVGVLHNAAREAGFAASSLWVPVPHYVATPPNPKATRALLGHLAALHDLPLDLTDLEIAAAAWERSVQQVVAADDEVAGYVARLEAHYDLDDDEEGDDGDVDEDLSTGDELLAADELPSGDALAADFERYLRDQGDDGDEGVDRSA
jgi:proteasome assembly chaperone (PAC2) family protein